MKHTNKMLENARSLRKNMTKEERHLWYDFLRNHPLKFYKQKIIGKYIADFYCDSAKLIIELDGSQHLDSGKEYDEKRTEFFNSLGILVLRFSNYDVMNHFDGVCTEINRYLNNKKQDYDKS